MQGVLHTVGGYMVYAAVTFKFVFDYHPGDIFWCTADCGWITGHTYVAYGPLLNGATVVIFEGVKTHLLCHCIFQAISHLKHKCVYS
jgi:acetyl-CoA synthetase